MGMGASVGPDYNAILVFNNSESLYITRQDSLEGGHIREQKTYGTASGNRSSVTVATNGPGFQYFNDLKEGQIFSRDIGFRYVKEATPKIEWNISAETKNIGEYLVYKATGKFRGRDYTVWFTTDIPLPFGPWKLQGLPGLILEAYDTHKEIFWYFKALEYPTEYAHLLKSIKNEGNWMSMEDHRKATIKAKKNAQAAGRMGAESAGVSVHQELSSSMLITYIENFAEKDTID